MIDYENMDDLLDVDDKTKLKIVKKEIKKILNLNKLLYDALHFDHCDEDGYIYATQLIDSSAWHIRKMFP